MNNSHDNRLDRLLEDWAGKSAASKEDLTALRRRVVEQLEDAQFDRAPLDSAPLDIASAVAVELPPRSTTLQPTTSRPTISGQFLAAGFAAAAVLLVAVGTWCYRAGHQPTDSPLQFAESGAYDLAKSFEADWPRHLRRQKRLLSEYRNVFGQGISWVTETEQGCDVGLAATEVRNAAPNEYITIQLWLVARNQQNGHTEVHAISVLAGREEWVEIPDTVGGGPLVLWAHPVDEEMISIDLRYQPASVAGVQIDGSHLQRVGQVTNIQSFERDGIEYQLYQTADLLDTDDLG